jgi:hypothetical protein
MKLRLALLLLCLFTFSTPEARADTINFAINGNANPRPDGFWGNPNQGFVVTSPTHSRWPASRPISAFALILH